MAAGAAVGAVPGGTVTLPTSVDGIGGLVFVVVVLVVVVLLVALRVGAVRQALLYRLWAVFLEAFE